MGPVVETTFYDLLGVSRDAPVDAIRSAYRGRIRVLHPDRFDRERQPEEWNVANAMLRQLNEAFGTLSDSIRRAEYDATLTSGYDRQGRNESNPTGFDRAESQSTERGALNSGEAGFKSLPPAVQKRLRARTFGRSDVDQVRIALDDIWASYLGIVALSCWFIYVAYHAMTYPWSSGAFFGFLTVTIIVSVLIGLLIESASHWHRSPLRCHLLFTPLYVIKTNLDRVSYWPHWEIQRLNATNRHKDGTYQRTDVELLIGNHLITFHFFAESSYSQLVRTLKEFQRRARTHAAAEDWNYFERVDDFREVTNPTTPPSNSSRTSQRVTISTFGVVVAIFGFFAIELLNTRTIDAIAAKRSSEIVGRTEKLVPVRSSSTVNSGAAGTFGDLRPTQPLRLRRLDEPEVDQLQLRREIPSPPRPVLSSIPNSGELELSLPGNGILRRYPGTPRASDSDGPLEIKTSGKSNYLVKLIDHHSDRPLLVVFVRGGSTVEVGVPPGKYKVRYASGDKWYGELHLFGPDTNYSEADAVFDFANEGDRISGYTITLYPVAFGNLRTRNIAPDAF